MTERRKRGHETIGKVTLPMFELGTGWWEAFDLRDRVLLMRHLIDCPRWCYDFVDVFYEWYLHFLVMIGRRRLVWLITSNGERKLASTIDGSTAYVLIDKLDTVALLDSGLVDSAVSQGLRFLVYWVPYCPKARRCE